MAAARRSIRKPARWALIAAGAGALLLLATVVGRAILTIVTLD